MLGGNRYDKLYAYVLNIINFGFKFVKEKARQNWDNFGFCSFTRIRTFHVVHVCDIRTGLGISFESPQNSFD